MCCMSCIDYLIGDLIILLVGKITAFYLFYEQWCELDIGSSPSEVGDKWAYCTETPMWNLSVVNGQWWLDKLAVLDS